MLEGKHITAVPTSGVTAELGAIAERRAYALELWDGAIQEQWSSLRWFQGQLERQIERLARGERLSPSTLGGLQRSIEAAGDALQRMSDLEVEARAQVRGMDRFIDWAKQHSRIDAYLADQFRLQRAGLTLDQLEDVSEVA